MQLQRDEAQRASAWMDVDPLEIPLANGVVPATCMVKSCRGICFESELIFACLSKISSGERIS